MLQSWGCKELDKTEQLNNYNKFNSGSLIHCDYLTTKSKPEESQKVPNLILFLKEISTGLYTNIIRTHFLPSLE